jgi:hypothetical protein
MARKLKSDRVLFITTILLVGLSIVMVYSASAVLALERTGQPYLFLTKQAMWATLGMAVMAVIMRVDYRNYREPAFLWSCVGVVAFAWSVAQGAGQRARAGSASAHRRPAVGVGQDRGDLLHRGAARARCTVSTTSVIRSRSGGRARPGGADPA